MVDFLIVVILVAILGGAAWYIYKAKKNGKKCIGCPDSGSCGAGGCSGCSGCSCGCGTKE